MIKYITFDDYYNVNDYNNFLDNLNYNKITYKEYVCIKPPYHFYIGIDEIYLPVFLKYKEIAKGLEKYLLEKVIGFYPNELFNLKRKVSDNSTQFEKFISPKIFQDIKFNNYACVFRYRNKEELIRITRELGIQVWILGKHREWNLAFTYNNFVKNYIPLDWILVEKKKASDFMDPGMFEFELNYKKLVKVKLNNKLVTYPYYDNGVYYPLKKTK